MGTCLRLLQTPRTKTQQRNQLEWRPRGNGVRCEREGRGAENRLEGEMGALPPAVLRKRRDETTKKLLSADIDGKETQDSSGGGIDRLITFRATKAARNG